MARAGSIYLDDVSPTTRNLYSRGTAEPRFFDIDPVEVLRGPQGTMYGASSLGGTIKFISNQPDATRVSGNAYTELSTTSHGGTNYLGQAVLNVPLVQNQTALRIGVQTGHDSGYIDQVSPNTTGRRRQGHQQHELERAQARAEVAAHAGLVDHAEPVLSALHEP